MVKNKSSHSQSQYIQEVSRTGNSAYHETATILSDTSSNLGAKVPGGEPMTKLMNAMSARENNLMLKSEISPN